MVNYASRYSSQVDERFKLGSLTTGIVNNDYDWVGVETVKVFSVPTTGMNDYSLTGANRYGTPSELGNKVQEMTLTQDRSFTFTIDRKSGDDTMMTMAAGKALRRQIDEVVIPEIDIYRISKVVASVDPAHIRAVTATKENAYEEFLATQEILDNAKVPPGGRVCLCTAGYFNNLKLDGSFTKTGDMATKIALTGLVGECDGVVFVKAPVTYFPVNVDFFITNPITMPSPMKLAEYNVHEDPPGISGWLIEGRVRYDAFVLNEKKAAIGVHKSTTQGG